MKILQRLSALLLLTAACSACHPTKESMNKQAEQPLSVPGPAAIIYKTSGVVSDHVFVIMNPEHTAIESYPDIRDVKVNGNFTYPTPLHQGYYLDNRGITANAVFLTLTYAEYAALPSTPVPSELMKYLMQNVTVTQMYRCGLRSAYGDPVNELNLRIDAGDFSGFTKLR
jgi:hypothetical protein